MDEPIVQSLNSRCEITTRRVIWSIENFLIVVKDNELFESQTVCNFTTEGVGSVKQLGWKLYLKRNGKKWVDVYIVLKTVDGKDARGKNLEIYAQRNLTKLKAPFDKDNKAPIYISEKYMIGNYKSLVEGRLCWSEYINLDKIKKKLDNGTLHLQLDLALIHKTSSSAQKTIMSFVNNLHCKSIPKAANAIAKAAIKGSIPFTDVKIITGDNQELQTRWGVLAARSPVFKANYLTEMEERKTGIIKMPQMSGKAAKVLLHFIQEGELLPAWEDDDVIVELTNTAAMYELADLLKFLDQVLGVVVFERGDNGKDKLSLEIIWKLLSLAHKLPLKNAEKGLLTWVRKKSLGSAECLLKPISIYSED